MVIELRKEEVLRTREDIKDFILLLENKFPVNDWTFNDTHFWPFIRIQLFFYLRSCTYDEKKNQEKGIPGTSVKTNKAVSHNRIVNLFKKLGNSFLYHNWKRKIHSKKYVFTGLNAHRMNYKGAFYNRFFDTIIDENNLKNDAYFVEIGNRKVSELANAEIILQSNEAIDYFTDHYFLKEILFKKNDIIFNFNGYQEFFDFLNQNEITKGFANKFSEKYLENIVKNKYNIHIQFYTELFKKIKPEKILILCYYSDLAMIAAANKLGIETIEMQHGAQTQAHMAYGSWSKVPQSGYDFLPRSYWSWDSFSKNAIGEWADKNKLYKTFVGGNTWVEYWLNKNDEYKSKNFILYTLQPDSLRLDELFPEPIINLIQSNKQKWFIRLHPRQLNKLNEIQSYLKERNVLDLVNITEATNDPLPLLLKNCALHLTNSSASTIEAALFNKKTILLHEIGKLYYADMIAAGMAEFIPVDNNFEMKFETYLQEQNNQENKKNELPFYKKYFAN